MHRHTNRCWLPAKMTYLVLVWTTLTCLCWTPGSAQVQAQQNPKKEIRYPKIDSTEMLVCECHLDPCDLFLWFRILEGKTQPQFLVSVNNAERLTHNTVMNTTRFKATMSNIKSTLRIPNVMREDSGVYSCVSKSKKTEGVWMPGVLLLPGVTPPTAPPKPKPKPEEPVCGCWQKPKPQPKGCGSVVLWPMVGILAGLAMALLSTLYYFSRLPKKCRHHFVKKGPMTRN